MAYSIAYEEWLVSERLALAAATRLAHQLSSGQPSTPDQLAELERLRADAATKLRAMMTVAKAVSDRAPL